MCTCSCLLPRCLCVVCRFFWNACWVCDSVLAAFSSRVWQIDMSACSGLMHESVNVNNAGDYTRPWFAWANSLFGGLVMKIADEHPNIIFG